MTPKISIIIPIYKVEKYLRRCLDSVINQTFQDWVAICVDDGSPDKCGEIAEEYAARDKRFVVVHKENRGLSSTRNSAMDLVVSKYIMFLDSDDCIHPQTIEILYNLAEQNDVDVVSYRLVHGDSSNNIPDWFSKKYDIKKIKIKVVDDLLRYATNKDKGMKSWYVQQGVVTTHLFRFDHIKSMKFVEEVHILEDFIFWSGVLFSHTKAVITRLTLYSYTQNPKSILHTADYVKSTFNLIQAVKFSYMELTKKNISWLNSRIWRARFMYDILARIYSYVKKIEDKKILHEIALKLADLKNIGVFDNPPDFHAWRYKRRLLKFISKN